MMILLSVINEVHHQPFLNKLFEVIQDVALVKVSKLNGLVINKK